MKKDIYLLLMILSLIYFSYLMSKLEKQVLLENPEEITDSAPENDEPGLAISQVDYRQLFIETALKEEGYTEKADNYTKYGAYYGLPNSEWCALYVSWVANQAGISSEVFPEFASVANGATLFKELNAYYSKADYTPIAGDIIFFLNNASHTGIVLKTEAGRVYTIEGNSADMVAKRNYSLLDQTISGYASPNYQLNK